MIYASEGTVLSLLFGNEKRTIFFTEKRFTVSRISHKLAEPTITCSVTRRCRYLFRCLRRLPSHLMLWCFDVFRQIFPFQSEFRKGKTATWLLLPPVVFFSSPTFWEACDQPEPGSSFALPVVRWIKTINVYLLKIVKLCVSRSHRIMTVVCWIYTTAITNQPIRRSEFVQCMKVE